jgi:HTH-type transcriptional regulator / antitoxin HipB
MYPIQNTVQLAAYIRSLRKSRGLTQTELGNRLGVSTNRISDIEHNPGVVSFEQLLAMIQTLGGRLYLDADVGSSTVRAPSSTPATGEW